MTGIDPSAAVRAVELCELNIKLNFKFEISEFGFHWPYLGEANDGNATEATGGNQQHS